MIYRLNVAPVAPPAQKQRLAAFFLQKKNPSTASSPFPPPLSPPITHQNGLRKTLRSPCMSALFSPNSLFTFFPAHLALCDTQVDVNNILGQRSHHRHPCRCQEQRLGIGARQDRSQLGCFLQPVRGVPQDRPPRQDPSLRGCQRLHSF